MKGILTNENNDLLIKVKRNKEGKITSGVVIGEVNTQIAEHVVTAFRGEYKEVPLIGGGVHSMLNGAPDPFWASDVRRQLQSQLVDADVNVSRDGDIVVNTK